MFHSNKKIFLFLIAILIFIAIQNLPTTENFNQVILNSLAVTGLMFFLWVSEALPIPITSLVPIIAFPILGILEINQVAGFYSNKITFLLLSGFILALALSKWRLNERIALHILSFTGNSARGIILGFMISTAFLSMWISNTATTVIMVPIALSLLSVLKLQRESSLTFAKILLLAIAYAASVGGMGTIVGTGTNGILVNHLSEIYNQEFSFAKWFITFIPLVAILLIILWGYLSFIQLHKSTINVSNGSDFIAHKLKELGNITYEEKWVTTIFILIACSWIFKGILPFKISDAAIGIAGTSLLFLIPDKKQKGFLMDWNDTQNVSWGTLLLFGGGVALAKGLEQSGFITIIGNYVNTASESKIILGLILTIFLAVFLTEFVSNVALATVMIPVLAIISLKFTGSPLTFSLPATVATSCAFMLPMATPPNAIIFGSGMISIKDMFKIGFIANLLSAIIIILYTKLIL